MALNYIVPKVELVDTSLKDTSKVGIRLADVRWSVKTAGPSPADNIRTEIFLEGCKKAIEGSPCKGCFNSSTWIHGRNPLQDPILVARHIAKNCNGYVTIGGGEPTDQIDGLILLVKELKRLNINVIVYTWRKLECFLFDNNQGVLPIGKTEGYNIEEDMTELLRYVDYVIDGEFIEEEKVLDFKSSNVKDHFVGSGNQTIWDVKKGHGYELCNIVKIEMNNENKLIVEEK